MRWLDLIPSFIDVMAGKWFDWRSRRQYSGLPADLRVRQMDISERELRAILEHPAIAELANQAAAMLDPDNPLHSVGFVLMPRADVFKGRMVNLTIRWAHNASPEQVSERLGSAMTFILNQLEVIPMDKMGLGQRVSLTEAKRAAKLSLAGIDWRVLS